MEFEPAALNTKHFDQMYEMYSADPQSVDSSWRKLFDSLDDEPQVAYKKTSDKGVADLIHAYRRYGHLLAKVNPIETKEPPFPEELDISYLGFSKGDLEKQFSTCGLSKEATLPLKNIIALLKEIYCRNIGVEYMSRGAKKLEPWLQNKIEASRFNIELSIDQKQLILQHLNKSGLFEWFLQTKYVGQKRFSLEGGETLIPMIAALAESGVSKGVEEIIIGMAHRGRINVLCNILGKTYRDLFSEFEDHYVPESSEGSGDVKYHKGFSSEILTKNGAKVKISISPNPSHLEAVDPVVQGQVRAIQKQKDDVERAKVIPLLIHGDAAISGQGVIYETLQLSKLEGYETGGTLHIVINNQVGFTTFPEDGRSTRYCTDIAKTFGAPVFHVNAEDPEGCVLAVNLALEMRQKFHCDVFIDLNCYRKYGHNEADEPSFTQPLEYQIIRKRKSIRELYRDQLLQEGMLERAVAQKLEEEFTEGLQEALKSIKDKDPKPSPERDRETVIPEIPETKVLKETLHKVATVLAQVPEDFNLHKKIQSLIENRKKMVTEDSGIDWGMAELLAYGTVLLQKRDIRISGQDCRRGTFSHRHAIWMDQKVERGYFPLQHLSKDQGTFDIYNSPLSEVAVLGFDYGYSTKYLEGLTIWEAQFGDFANSAQVVIDQFISTGDDKWRQKSNLVLLLPHGYEGQGPEHSSARIERFLTLCGDNNMFVCNPTTPAQLFHLLRIERSKPLVIFTPKGLLRHPKCISHVDELTDGVFERVKQDPKPPKKPRRILFCSGRIFYDLLEEREKRESEDIALIRIEQIYPLSMNSLTAAVKKYPEVDEWLWVQEEPSNMGAFNFMRAKLQKLLPKNGTLSYAGRGRCASPATGSHRLHKEEHLKIMNQVFSKGSINEA